MSPVFFTPSSTGDIRQGAIISVRVTIDNTTAESGQFVSACLDFRRRPGFQQFLTLLTVPYQKALFDAIEPTEKWSNNQNEEAMSKAIEGLQDNGMIILKPDLDSFKKTAAEAIVKELDGNLWPAGLYDKIRAMAP
jgi:predicted RNase H-related nuclease YkuK (DUF458 family)